MPVEMRELIIKTEIKTRPTDHTLKMAPQEIMALKQQIIDECLRLFKDRTQRDSFNR